jgi:hypothetical protein
MIYLYSYKTLLSNGLHLLFNVTSLGLSTAVRSDDCMLLQRFPLRSHALGSAAPAVRLRFTTQVIKCSQGGVALRVLTRL